MLSLTKIQKKYLAGDNEVEALKGIDINFRRNEFVSILGPSGCGKTTLLNIIGGLDHYTSGDLKINGISTKDYHDSDWDAYRNHSIGFVFQSYNLIPHQTVLANVELALTLSGVGKAERRRRAVEALQKVGLGDQLKKKPNQMSGGQMQRVAIARALVNDPEILLADEPTGALDSETSVSVMEILKEVAKNKLVIMVTHNPALAEEYSTRIIRLLDGNVIGDTDPYEGESNEELVAALKKSGKNAVKSNGRQKKTSMSFFTALSLSLNNLMTKKARTFLTSFAGSIGIIGIALILSLSYGVQDYINDVQEDTLSSYPITIQTETVDINALLTAMTGAEKEIGELDHDREKVYSNVIMYDLFNKLMSIETQKNDLQAFKSYIDANRSDINEYASAVVYGYDVDLNIYADDSGEVRKLFPSELMSSLRGESDGQQQMMSSFASYSVWEEILPGKDGELINDLIYEQYDVIAGRWPESYDEIVLAVDKNNEISDMVIYMLGLKSQDEFNSILQSVIKQEQIETEAYTFTYDELLELTFKLIPSSAYYKQNIETGLYEDMSDNETYMNYLVSNGVKLKVVGIIRPNEDAISSSITGNIAYTSALTHYVANVNNESGIVKAQLASADEDVVSGLKFLPDDYVEPGSEEKSEAVKEYFLSIAPDEGRKMFIEIMSEPTESQLYETATQMMAAYPDRASREEFITAAYSEQTGMDAETVKSYLSSMSDSEIEQSLYSALTEAARLSYAENNASQLEMLDDNSIAAAFAQYLDMVDPSVGAELYDKYMPKQYSDSSYSHNLSDFGYVDLDVPSTINFYAASFEAKDRISDMISEYNKNVDEDSKITYTDYIALMLSSITTIINAISYILIAFVAISLVVSSIMIGIITYISVLERTKEIGILRAVGASKRDISRVFNAETLIVGFAAGVIGIGATLLLTIPINIIIQTLADITASAQLPVAGAVILIAISMVLTLIAGVFPARIAAKKDPVEALRTE